MKRLTVLATLMAMSLAACHNDDDDHSTHTPTPNSKTTTVTPSLGQISNAAIKATCSGTQTVMGQANIGSNGSANLSLSGMCASPIVFELVATATSQYYDEAAGSLLSLPAGTVLRVAVPSLQGLSSNIGMTALTEMAVQRALQLGSTLNAANVEAANQAIAAAFFEANSNINLLSAPTLWSSSTTQLGAGAADLYAFYLATLAKLADGEATPALTALALLAQDFKDGQIDQVEGLYANAEQLRAAQKAAMQELSAFANSDLKEKLALTGEPVDPDVPSCGNQTTLAIADLASYVGTYNVKIIDSNAATDANGFPIPVKTTTLSLTATGQVTLDGQIAKTVKVCGNSNTVTGNTGVVAYLDKNDALGRSHVDFWKDNTVNGTDFTSAATFRYFNGTKQGTTPVDPTPNTSCDGNTNPFGCVTISNLPQFTNFEHVFSSPPQALIEAGQYTWTNGTSIQPNSTSTNLNYGFSTFGAGLSQLTYVMTSFDAKGAVTQRSFQCGSSKIPACNGITLNNTNRTFTLSSTVLTEINPTGDPLTLKLTLSGTLKF